MAKARGIPPLGRTPNALPAPQAPAYLPMAKARGITQDLVTRGFVDDLRLGLHATYPAPSAHESALVYARDRPAFASCDSAGSPAPRHARWRGRACRRAMSGPSP